MLWRIHPTLIALLLVRTFGTGIVGIFLILSLLGGKTWAQSTVYSWTDEKGVVHFSDSMVPPQHVNDATQIEMPSHPASIASGADTSDNIPLVIMNDDPSQKF